MRGYSLRGSGTGGNFVNAVEFVVFKARAPILVALALFTLAMGYYAVQLRMEAGFLKQVPTTHEYVQTFLEYENQVPGANLVLVSVKAREGTIWTAAFMKRLHDVAEEVAFLPGVRRTTVRSLWATTTRVTENTEEGINAYPVVPHGVTIQTITEADVEIIRDRALNGKHKGFLVSNDHRAALVMAELQEVDPLTGERLDYLVLADALETKIRKQYEDTDIEIQIVGFAKFIGDIADGAGDVFLFFVLAFVLTTLAVFIYSRSPQLTFLAVFCSLVSVVWQFGLLHLMDRNLDPLAVLVPFLVYAIGVSHGVQQINLIGTELSEGKTADEAARATFRRLLIPGSLALITDLVGFGTLYLIPIEVIQDLAVMAALGVALKIVTNLVMLPLVASYIPVREDYAATFARLRHTREEAMAKVGAVARPVPAAIALVVFVVLLGAAVHETRNRHTGDLTAGFSELWPSSRYNRDIAEIVERFSISADALIVVVETPPDACIHYETMRLIDRFSWAMRNVSGVNSVQSLPTAARETSAIWREGNLRWIALPRTETELIQTTSLYEPSSGLLNEACTILPVIIYLDDHKAETIETLIAAIKHFRSTDPEAIARDDVNFRLAMGGVGVMAATNDVIEANELPMLAWVYAVIVLLVYLAYRDWRAIICCCMPLLMATFLGYWVMTALNIGLKVSTLPVLVLATGIGVDYAFYIYSRLQVFLDEGKSMAVAYGLALQQIGVAVIFTGLTLAIGVSTWAFSGLKLQADMGILLSFMFLANMVAAIIFLPAFAVTLDRLFPRRLPIR
ncbi:putative exporter of RND superfamily [Parvibaculum lavamentivorans DS-1]|uniref:Putative exporter of RND superfamily n=1 Tax=Parvibaculum lavamentivorans (strain DS-1 / DSM 13023 / NCIMB 13966) TaxID=402881 RepID=A7HUN7_PARL1|nr:putative exporter of RND superfamily [Parvibaculum lavamentivorans DS-1]